MAPPTPTPAFGVIDPGTPVAGLLASGLVVRPAPLIDPVELPTPVVVEPGIPGVGVSAPTPPETAPPEFDGETLPVALESTPTVELLGLAASPLPDWAAFLAAARCFAVMAAEPGLAEAPVFAVVEELPAVIALEAEPDWLAPLADWARTGEKASRDTAAAAAKSCVFIVSFS